MYRIQYSSNDCGKAFDFCTFFNSMYLSILKTKTKKTQMKRNGSDNRTGWLFLCYIFYNHSGLKWPCHGDGGKESDFFSFFF